MYLASRSLKQWVSERSSIYILRTLPDLFPSLFLPQSSVRSVTVTNRLHTCWR